MLTFYAILQHCSFQDHLPAANAMLMEMSKEEKYYPNLFNMQERLYVNLSIK